MIKEIENIQVMLNGLCEHGDVTEAARSSIQFTINEAKNKAINYRCCCEKLPYPYERQLKRIDELNQTQISTNEQLQILRHFANKLGLYDAADYLKK